MDNPKQEEKWRDWAGRWDDELSFLLKAEAGNLSLDTTVLQYTERNVNAFNSSYNTNSHVLYSSQIRRSSIVLFSLQGTREVSITHYCTWSSKIDDPEYYSTVCVKRITGKFQQGTVHGCCG